MTRPVSSPRQMALSQTLKRNVFRKPLEAAPKAPSSASPAPAAVETPASPPSVTEKGVPASAGAKVGRNDPCACGSGKKFKKCCGA